MNAELANIVKEAQNQETFTLEASKVGEFLAGDYLYVVQKNSYENIKKKIVKLNGEGFLFKKIKTSGTNVIRQGYVPKVTDNEGTIQFKIAQNSNIESNKILYNDFEYVRVNLTGAVIQELLNQPRQTLTNFTLDKE